MPTKAKQHRPSHVRARDAADTATPARLDDRKAAHLRGYDHRWNRLRNRHIAAHPFCQLCEARGELVYQNVVVDHIEPVDVNPARRLDPMNLQTLCRPCHTIKTNADLRKYGRRA